MQCMAVKCQHIITSVILLTVTAVMIPWLLAISRTLRNPANTVFTG